MIIFLKLDLFYFFFTIYFTSGLPAFIQSHQTLVLSIPLFLLAGKYTEKGT